MHSKGMGGASIAFPQDAVSIGQNPAAAAAVGNRWTSASTSSGRFAR